jgi:hypothetical protein
MSDSGMKRRTLVGALTAAGATVALVAILTVGAGAGTAASAAAPVNTSPPTITGTAQQGQTLVGHRGQWSESPTDYNDFWMRCDKDGGSCANISGATDKNGYVLKNVDVGNTIRFKVQAKNADGNTVETSVPTAVVTVATAKPAPPAANGCAATGATIPVTSISSPARLAVDQTQISPSTILYSTRSITARFHVSACGGSVQGALVYVTAVPYGQLAPANEQATGSDGWATVQFAALGGYPVSKNQQLLVMFVRARKAGDPLLGGISIRRLVSFHVTRG